jgi:tape measure domain-containing protein
MSGNIDDLKFSLDVDLSDSLKDLKQTLTTLNQVETSVKSLAPAYTALNDATMRLAASGSLPVKNAELLMAGLGSIGRSIDTLDGQLQRMDQRIETAVAASTDLSEYWLYVNRDVKNTTETMRRFTEQTKAAAAAAQTVVVDTVTQKIKAPQASGGFEMVKLASAALAVAAIDRVTGAMTTAKNAITGINTTTRVTISSLDRFRIGLAAPAVNPALNTLPGLIQNISSKMASGVESVRGFGDATIAGAPKILEAIAKGMGQVMGAGDSMQATVSKIAAAFEIKRQALDRVAKIYPTTGTAVDFLKRAMDVVAPAAERVAQTVDKSNDSIRAAAIGARNLAFLATGSFQKTGTSADLYARGAYHALLPTRLMVFESKFAAGSLNMMRSAYMLLTHPIHAVSMAIQKGRGEFKELRANLPPLTGGLQLGTRAFRAFSHATYFTATALKMIRTSATPIVWVGQKIWSLVQPAKAARVGLDGVAVAGQRAGIVLRGVQSAAGTAASAISKVGSTAMGAGQSAFSSMGNSIASIPGKTALAATALAGVGIAMMGVGSKVAMATEKNQAVFGVMLKDMGQGKAVVDSLQNSKAVGLFDNDEVLNSGRLLFKAGVAAIDLKGKTEQLATIAAATSTELGDLTRIYQQGANQGSFGQDKINQLAERGIDIYHALEAATGQSGAALKKMISDGKIGVPEMDAALAHLTEGQGIYAGSLETLGNTTSGMLATIKNNIMQALGTLMGAGTEARKPFLQMLVGWSESVKNGIGAVVPLISQFAEMVKSIFTGLSGVMSGLFGGIFSGASSMFSGIIALTMEWLTKFKWFFMNLWPIAKFTFNLVALTAVTAFNDIAYWLTDTMPAYAQWFSDNFVNIFSDMGSAVGAIIVNMGTNIKNNMMAIWNWIKSGGTESLALSWVPLLDGFKSTLSELPNVPERAMTELEKSMQAHSETLGTQLADSFDKLNTEANIALTTKPEELPAINPDLKSGGMNTGSEDGAGGDAAAGARGSGRTNFMVDSLDRGSQGALNAIFAGRDKLGNQQLSEQKKTNQHLAKLVQGGGSSVVFGAV